MVDIYNQLKKDDKVVITELEELIEFTYTEISKLTVEYQKLRLKKFYLYMVLGNTFTKVSSIKTLLKESKTISCHIILRTLVESFINLRYVYSERSENNLLKFLIADSIDRKELGKRVKGHIGDNPDIAHFGGVYDTQEYWEAYISKAEREIEYIKKFKGKPNLRGLPELRTRAKKSGLEWWYVNLYWLFSLHTHTTLRGLDAHMKKRKGAITFELEGDTEDIEKIAVTSYMILFSVLTLFFEKFKLDTKKLKPYREIFKKYVNRGREISTEKYM